MPSSCTRGLPRRGGMGATLRKLCVEDDATDAHAQRRKDLAAVRTQTEYYVAEARWYLTSSALAQPWIGEHDVEHARRMRALTNGHVITVPEEVEFWEVDKRGGEPPPSYDELLDERRRECQRELARLSKALRDAGPLFPPPTPPRQQAPRGG